MREELGVINGERMSFTGTIGRYGGKGGGKYTILMVDVRHLDGRLATDHVWFNLTKGFKDLRLQPGERVRFDARVKPYQGLQGPAQENRSADLGRLQAQPSNENPAPDLTGAPGR